MTAQSKNAGESIRTKRTRSDSSSLNWLKGDEKRRVIAYFHDRFGVPPRAFDNLRIHERNRGIWALNDSAWLSVLDKVPPDSAGLMILRRLSKGFKPTTIALQLFGKWMNRNVVILTEKDFLFLVKEKAIFVDKKDCLEMSRGYVAIKVGEYVVGCGFYKDGELVSQLPKSFSNITME